MGLAGTVRSSSAPDFPPVLSPLVETGMCSPKAANSCLVQDICAHGILRQDKLSRAQRSKQEELSWGSGSDPAQVCLRNPQNGKNSEGTYFSPDAVCDFPSPLLCPHPTDQPL